jgi:hypothetical protein
MPVNVIAFSDPGDYGRVLPMIRRLWDEGAVEFHIHATRAMLRTGLTTQDVEHVIFTGSIIEHNKPSGRSWRWRVQGGRLDGETASCVVTFERQGHLLIITVIDEAPERRE